MAARSEAWLAGGRTAVLFCAGALAAAAWLALWVWGASPGGQLGHHAGPHHGASSALFVPLFLGGWIVMTTAMMLPASVPLLATFQAVVQDRPDRPVLVALVIIGYLLTWTMFGGLVLTASLAAQGIAGRSSSLAPAAFRTGAWILFLAGAYQFTPLKHRCLQKCRSPFTFVIEHWRGQQERWHAFRLGVDHGLFCVGCCWALMLLMFVTGLGNLGWMFALAAVMAVEKNFSWGRRLSAPVGVVLIVAGIAAIALG
jgi:predicted metal-binding membrane protein